MKISCGMCEGTGKYWVLPSEKCRSCDGSGEVEIPSPTTENSEFWIQANGKSYKRSGEGGSGKWLLFVNKNEIDDTWMKIRQDTIDENLGSSSKVSTKRGWLNHGMPEDYVICVHTPNCKDREDVDRVRHRLRELGFTGQIGYKTDEATARNLDELLYKE